jgi:hypothetical protein
VLAKGLSIPAGTEIVTQGSGDYESYIPIIFIGQNGGYDDISDLIAQQQAVVDHGTGPEDRYLIIGLHTGDARSRAELESAMEEAWGDAEQPADGWTSF